jgi:hypothetical protein
MALYQATKEEIQRAAARHAKRAEQGGSMDLVLNDAASRQRYLDAGRVQNKRKATKEVAP